MKPIFDIPPEQLRALLEQTIRAAPALTPTVPLSEDDERWLAKAEALVEASGSLNDQLDFSMARRKLGTLAQSRTHIMGPLLKAFERVELHAPATGQGRFIPPGETWNGYAALVKIIQPPCTDILIVDPYLDGSAFIDLMPQSNAKELVRCLTVKGAYHNSLIAAAHKWKSDGSSSNHPAEVRYAPPNSLHDRVIIVDRRDVWLISQSLKDIAAKSPATLTLADPEMANLKMAHYDALWDVSEKPT